MRFVHAPGLILLLLCGCNQTRWNMVKGPEKNAPPPTGLPTVAQLVDYLNDNAQRVQNIRCDEMWLTCTADGQSFDLRGKMVAQKPRNFRLSADTLGSQVVDLGSNDQEFWYWISKAKPPYVYCSYKDLAEGRVRSMPFPFQPDWIMESFGLGPYGPPERYSLEYDAETIKLVERTRSPQGAPVRKVIVCRRRPAQPPQPQVTAYLLLDDSSGKEICSAHITEVSIDRATGATLPRRLELRWPAERFKLGMKMDTLTINPQLPPAIFVRQPRQGINAFNLAREQYDNPLQQTQGRP
jgi:hypothetical protein